MKKYAHLLLAVDVYEDDTALIEEVLNLAKTYGSQLSLVHVTPHVISSAPFAYDFQDAVVQHAKNKFAELKKQFGFKDEQLFLREGFAKHEVVNLAKEIKADLIVCGSHGKHGLQLMLGSTVNGILHLSSVDVLTIRIDESGKRLAPFPYKNIVLAVDFFVDNKKVRDTAIALAEQFNAKLHLIHVVADVAALGYYPAVEFDLSGDAKKQIKELIAKENIPVNSKDVHIPIGFPKQEILELANHVNAELIIVGSHGHKALASAVLGSTANAVLHNAKSDVLVVRI